MNYPLSRKTSLILVAIVSIAIVSGVLLRDRIPSFKDTEAPPVPIASAPSMTSPMPAHLAGYIEVTNSCDYYFGGACVNVRSGPGTNFPAVTKLRNGIVLVVSEQVDGDSRTWYKVTFDEWIRYPERISGDWYVAAEFVRYFETTKAEELSEEVAASEKRIVIDRSEQVLYAYDGGELFMKEPTSTGLNDTPTPRGSFRVFRKTPTRYMQGPLPGISDEYYDLPGVPWNLYFTREGGAIHGAYWHNDFGQPHSHGCVNLPTVVAQRLYAWADLGTQVTVQD